ncbi:SNF2 family N-terminal domain-containing protein [Xylariomycetidae sp. FL0641]|nr:SNF2 family N-terminal domain-containing protein [Xylariomycetidae sp. FL0641]
MDPRNPYEPPAKRPRLAPLSPISDYGDVRLDGQFENHDQASNQRSLEFVCFGMVSGIIGAYEYRGIDKLASPLTIRIDSANRFSSEDFPMLSGKLDAENGPMIESLLEEPSLTLYAACVLDAQQTPKQKNRRHALVPCTLDITVYGPMDLFDEIGTWFQEYEVYLQDPKFCHRDAPYCNPQKLSSEPSNEWPLVSEVANAATMVLPVELPAQPDLLDVLSTHIDLEEAPQPSVVRTALKRHQKQALTFMLNREAGWNFDQSRSDVWEIVDAGSGRVFMNTISRTWQAEEPSNFQGGIIADPMGLGKTLTMTALVASDLDTPRLPLSCLSLSSMAKPEVSATLVVVPPPLLDSWEEQFQEHLITGSLTSCRHHGKSRVTGTAEFTSVNIVLTTYHTVSAEWRQEKGTGGSSLFSVQWRRIILDEAHFIRNGNAQMSRAVCELQASSRWAVTGTPIQNRIADLASLLKFIRAHPYTDPKVFDTDVCQLWKTGEVEKAADRLQRLSACLLLRRPQKAIDLPPRRDLIYAVDFTSEERVEFERLRHQTIMTIDDALINVDKSMKHRVYINALQRIESLRLFSNLGLHYQSRHSMPPRNPAEIGDWESIAQRVFDSQRAIATLRCAQCSSVAGFDETVLDDGSQSTHGAQFASCLQYTCADCVGKSYRLGYSICCSHTPFCESAAVTTSDAALEEAELVHPDDALQRPLEPPSKIKALIDDVKRLPRDRKCVIFSTWSLTLDLVHSALADVGIRCIRFDGKVPQKERGSVVKTFRSNPNIRVMLLTLSCGAVGLNLTVASRAYLIEPHWNPTIEEQALARIHRLGQVREVETVRFYVKDSLEEQVMKLQEDKRQLAKVLLDPHESGNTNNNLNILERLRALL